MVIYSWFSHSKSWFSIAMLVYQRANLHFLFAKKTHVLMTRPGSWGRRPCRFWSHGSDESVAGFSLHQTLRIVFLFFFSMEKKWMDHWLFFFFFRWFVFDGSEMDGFSKGFFPWVFRKPLCVGAVTGWFHWDSDFHSEELEKMPGGVVKVLAKHGPEAGELIHWNPVFLAIDPATGPWNHGFQGFPLKLMGIPLNSIEYSIEFHWIPLNSIEFHWIPLSSNVQLCPVVHWFSKVSTYISPPLRSCCVQLHLQWMPGICWRWWWRWALRDVPKWSAALQFILWVAQTAQTMQQFIRHDQVIPSCAPLGVWFLEQ